MNADQTRDLKELYGSRTDAHVALRLSVSVSQVRRVATQLRLAKNKAKFKGRKMPRWDSEQVRTLYANYRYRSNLELAKMLGRSVKSVVSKAHALGLTKNPERLREMGRENVRKRRDR